MPPVSTSRSTLVDLACSMDVAVYARMSLDKTGEGLGVERQEQECRELAARLGVTVSNVFSDNDISATTGKRRPGFEALLASKPEAVIVWHIDRLVRVTKDLERVIDLGIPVHAVTAGHLDLATPAGRAVARTITAWSSYEGEQKAERQKAAARQRAAAGKSWWPTRPFGFEMDGSHRLPEAEGLKEAYRRLLAGNSLRSTALSLNDAGLITPKGNPWRAETLLPVLKNARNAGLRSYRGEVVGPAAWEAIVPEETWRAAVALLNDPARRQPRGPVKRYLLTGFATCGKCGSPLRVNWRGPKDDPKSYATYVCRGASCSSQRVQWLDKLVMNEVVRLWHLPEFRAALGGTDAPTTDDGAMGQEATDLRQRLDGLAVMYAEGKISASALEAGSRTIQVRLDELEALMGESRQPALPDVLQTLTQKGGRTIGAGAMFKLLGTVGKLDVEQKRGLVLATLESVTLIPRRRGMLNPRPEDVVIVPKKALPRRTTRSKGWTTKATP